jgi:hypothetical protein
VLGGSQKVRFLLAPRRLRNFGQRTWRTFTHLPGVLGQCGSSVGPCGVIGLQARDRSDRVSSSSARSADWNGGDSMWCMALLRAFSSAGIASSSVWTSSAAPINPTRPRTPSNTFPADWGSRVPASIEPTGRPVSLHEAPRSPLHRPESTTPRTATVVRRGRDER